jgi:glycosyltransferase involved in cell wall biosynthesis
VCYCHNPFRYAWNERERTLARQRDPITRAMLRGLFRRWRQWDWIAAQRTDRYVANSTATEMRIRAYFGREASVVYPPVETSRFAPGPVGDHYAVVSELMPHKDIALAIEAFNRLRRPLVVVGDGPEARALRRIAGPTIRFTGRVPDATVAEILQGARALVLTSVEEFGIAGVESQAAGRPVIARRGGGALETIQDGVTGCFWSGGAADLAATVHAFDDRSVDPQSCVGNAARFDASSFRSGLLNEVDAARAEGRTRTRRSTAADQHPDRPTRRARAAPVAPVAP